MTKVFEMVLMPLLIMLVRAAVSVPDLVRRIFISLLVVCILTSFSAHPAFGVENRESKDTSTHRREGSRITKVTGQVIPNGRRWSFVVGKDVSFKILENLSLQRIVQSVKADPTDKHWTVDAELTEFLGENYVVLTRIQRAGTPISSSSTDTSKRLKPAKSE